MFYYNTYDIEIFLKWCSGGVVKPLLLESTLGSSIFSWGVWLMAISLWGTLIARAVVSFPPSVIISIIFTTPLIVMGCS